MRRALAVVLGLVMTACKMGDQQAGSSGAATTTTGETTASVVATDDGGPQEWDGTKPFDCGNGRHAIHGLKVSLKGTAVHVGGKCLLVMKDVDLTAETALEVEGMASVTVVGGTFNGKVHAGGLTHTSLKGVTVVAQPVAVQSSDAAIIVLENGAVTGATAITADGSSRVTVVNTTVKGETKPLTPEAKILL